MNDRELIERLRGLLANATPGPWYTLDAPWLPSGSETSILAESPDPHVARFICDFDIWALDDDEGRKSENPDDDAALIVAAVNELPGLLDRLEALSAEVERLKEALATCDDAIREYFRYFHGGEMRGSYDGKPERAQLQKAGHAAFQALKGAQQ